VPTVTRAVRPLNQSFRQLVTNYDLDAHRLIWPSPSSRLRCKEDFTYLLARLSACGKLSVYLPISVGSPGEEGVDHWNKYENVFTGV